MTFLETTKLMTILQANYPDTFRHESEDITEARIATWNAVFANAPYATVQAAVLAYIASDTGRFMPTVGMIMNAINEFSRADELTDQQAWNLVMNAIRHASDAEKEFNRLPELCRKLLGSPSRIRSWGRDEHFNESVVSSNFMRSYRELAEREKKLSAAPAKALELLGANIRLPSLPAPSQCDFPEVSGDLEKLYMEF